MKSRRDLLVFILILIVLEVGAYWRWNQEYGKEITPRNPSKIVVLVWDRVEVTEKSIALPHQAWRVRCNLNLSGCQNLIVLRSGDRVEVRGVWREAKEDLGKVSYFEVNVVERLKIIHPRPLTPWWWVRQIQNFRDRVIYVYKTNLGEPYSGLLSGIVLGVKAELPAEFYQELIKTGTVHMIAASGYNISMVTGALIGGVVYFISRKKAVALATFGIVVYVIMAGATPPVIRAGIMGGLLALAQMSGRRYQAYSSLILSIAMMLFIWPWMWQSVSFLLSFSATVGIMWGAPVIKSQMSKLKTHNFKRKDDVAKHDGVLVGELGTTLAATLATLPIIMIYFGQVSLISPLINLLVLWLVPPIMILGSVLAVVGLMIPALGAITAYLVYPLLWMFIRIVEWGARVPFASVSGLQGNWWWALGWWIILFVWWWQGGRKLKRKTK